LSNSFCGRIFLNYIIFRINYPITGQPIISYTIQYRLGVSGMDEKKRDDEMLLKEKQEKTERQKMIEKSVAKVIARNGKALERLSKN